MEIISQRNKLGWFQFSLDVLQKSNTSNEALNLYFLFATRLLFINPSLEVLQGATENWLASSGNVQIWEISFGKWIKHL